jgi:Na+/H+ antiporter family
MLHYIFHKCFINIGGIPPEILPAMTFIIAFFMALATGTAWGTMTILFPLVLLPAYISSDGNPTIFYAVTSSILGVSLLLFVVALSKHLRIVPHQNSYITGSSGW